jgi:hypothetical protein
LTLAAATIASSQASAAAAGNDIFHVAIFRFAKVNINDAVAAFRALASASRQESGNLSNDIRGIDDDQEFYIVEHSVSPAESDADARKGISILQESHASSELGAGI